MTTEINSEEQRQEYRLSVSEAVYIELEAEQDGDATRILLSRSTDLSANGLQVEVDRPLPAARIEDAEGRRE